MTDPKKIEQIGYAAVRKLRRQNLQKGLPFLITSKNLPSKQGYLEYPSGSIDLVKIETPLREFTIIRPLTISEANSIRAHFHLTF